MCVFVAVFVFALVHCCSLVRAPGLRAAGRLLIGLVFKRWYWSPVVFKQTLLVFRVSRCVCVCLCVCVCMCVCVCVNLTLRTQTRDITFGFTATDACRKNRAPPLPERGF